MEKYIPYEKLSKKKKRELNTKQRNTWGSVSPVTRKPKPSKAYDRKKALRWDDDSRSVPFRSTPLDTARIGRIFLPCKAKAGLRRVLARCICQ